MNNKKFSFTGDSKTIDINGERHTLRRIKAERDINNPHCGLVKAGTLGGWLEYEYCLEEYGESWVADEAMVLGFNDEDGSEVFNDALVAGHALVMDHVYVGHDALVDGNATLAGYCVLNGGVHVGDEATVVGDVVMCDAEVLGSAIVMNPQYFVLEYGDGGVDEDEAEYMVLSDCRIGGDQVVLTGSDEAVKELWEQYKVDPEEVRQVVLTMGPTEVKA